MRKQHKDMIGIDEVGRGPLAGPVVVAGVRMGRSPRGLFTGIRDSKRLSPKAREKWFLRITRRSDIRWAVARVWPRVIDRINISQAANRGVLRVYRKLSVNNPPASPNGSSVGGQGESVTSRGPRFFAVLDGGLRLPRHIPHKTVIRGDEQVPLIAAASIIAKVMRDRIMMRLHRKYPVYRFDLHKGYGTELHRDLLGSHGYSDVHRKSFRFRVANTRQF